MDERRDAQPRTVEHDAMLAHQLGRALGGRDRHAAEDPGELAEPVAARLLERDVRAGAAKTSCIGATLKVGSGSGAGAPSGPGRPHVVADPAAAELGDLLLERHLGEQRARPARPTDRAGSRHGGAAVVLRGVETVVMWLSLG